MSDSGRVIGQERERQWDDRDTEIVMDEFHGEREYFSRELAALINRYSIDNAASTPDFVLAEYMTQCLVSYFAANKACEKWHNKKVERERAVEVDASQAKRVLFCHQETSGTAKTIGRE